MRETYRHRTWAEINLDAIKDNYNRIKSVTTSKVCCVIKANGYGHGAVELARINGTINYEVVCAVGERVPRAYVKEGHTVKWKDNLIAE